MRSAPEVKIADPSSGGFRRLRISRFALWLVLALWLGGNVFFGLVVAPSAFAVLPSAELAGRLVSRLLTVIFLGGAACGLTLTFLGRTLGQSRTTLFLSFCLAVFCLGAHFGISDQFEDLRTIHVAEETLEIRRRFTVLHRISVASFGAITLGLVCLLYRYVGSEAPDLSPRASEGEMHANS